VKLILVADDGTVLDAIEDVEEYDLSRPMARADLIDQIQTLVMQAKQVRR